MRCQKVKVLFMGLSEIYLSCYNLFCSSYITEEEINDLKRLCLCCLVVLLREVTIYIQNRLWDLVFQIGKESEKDLCCVGLILTEILKKAQAMEKSIHEQKAEFVYLCVKKKKNNSFEISVIILRYVGNVNLSY